MFYKSYIRVWKNFRDFKEICAQHFCTINKHLHKFVSKLLYNFCKTFKTLILVLKSFF